MQKTEYHAFTGMQKDLAYSRQKIDILTDARNIRISARGKGKLLSISNERGPLKVLENSIKGTILGYCSVGTYTVVFTHEGSLDHIYRIDTSKDNIEVYDLARGKYDYHTLSHAGMNLGFNVNYPIEALGDYENDSIQKVYWTDGLNPLRVIDITKTDYDWEEAFDYNPSLSLNEDIYIAKNYNTSGSFSPGVIQYAFTYYNKHRQESNIFYTSPLYYISHKDRGASPEDKVDCSFRIAMQNLDSHFDYVRIYSIQRTSLNATPVVKRLTDICYTPATTIDFAECTENSQLLRGGIVYIDTGYNGEDVSPSELLYKGGETILAGTIAQKDGTMFFGNITLNRSETTNICKSSDVIIEESTRTFYPRIVSSEVYTYANQLDSYAGKHKDISVPCGGFKYGNYYRCGVQFQHKSGRWSDPIFIKDVKVSKNRFSLESKTQAITAPTLQGTINADTVTELYGAGYRRARAVVVFPDLQDRDIVCQGVICPTLTTIKHRFREKDLYAQSSWFFRPFVGITDVSIWKENRVKENGTVGVAMPLDMNMSTNLGIQTHTIQNSTDAIRLLEIQGNYDNDDIFMPDAKFVGFYSPDIVFDDCQSLSFDNTMWKKAGKVFFRKTLSDIDIQTSSPVMDSMGSGFIHKSFTEEGSYGIVNGLFYDDVVIDDDTDKFRVYPKEDNSVKWFIYPWHRNGSLNNDASRPANTGTRTAQLKLKAISNLRYTETEFDSDDTNYNFSTEPKLFSSDQVSILKFGDLYYKGNIDTVLVPNITSPMYFCFDGDNITQDDSCATDFTSKSLFCTMKDKNDDEYGKVFKWGKQAQTEKEYDFEKGEYVDKITGYIDTWVNGGDSGTKMGSDSSISIAEEKESVRMKYKSCPHLAMQLPSNAWTVKSGTYLPIIEVVRATSSDTRFGGDSEEALKANTWIPCGEPVRFTKESDNPKKYGECKFNYDYGDTYFQRWDCLKTYAFSLEDQNQVVEIGSFMLETNVNIDGRYDKNRGQINNTIVSPTNFNLYNPVYSQKDNFFSYRILDSDYYKQSKFANQITWTLEKSPGSDVDAWTSVTLASTHNMDGSKGEIRSLVTWGDKLYCFQDNCVSIISFNSRVQIPTSDGVPIEISNNYKVDGHITVSDGLGCINKYSICATPSGLYFMDYVGKHLQCITSQGVSDISLQRFMTTWTKEQRSDIWKPNDYSVKLFYDKNNLDLYVITGNESLCYNEGLSQFTSFFDYSGVPVMFNSGDKFYCIKNSNIYKMSAGEYNNFFGEYKPFSIQFVSNGSSENLTPMDKIFTNLDYRADRWQDEIGQTVLNDKSPFNYMQVYNEYQDTGVRELVWEPKRPSILKRKFRIWKIAIPRDKTHKMDRIRSPWSLITLGYDPSKDTVKNNPIEFHDISVQFYI